MSVGDKVRLVHSPSSVGIVSSLDDDGAMVCLPIAGRYQLRGPVPLSALELVVTARENKARRAT